jgi:hypothetical protein
MRGVLIDNRGGAGRWLVILIIVVAAVFGYQYFKKTPRYALIQFKKAVLFSNAEAARQYMDLDRVVPGLPEKYTNREPDENVKNRLIYEIDSPTEKSIIKSVKQWSVVMSPITVSENRIYATATPLDGTNITLEKTKQDKWVITRWEISE